LPATHVGIAFAGAPHGVHALPHVCADASLAQAPPHA
jgi:hypothetical protein